MKMKVGRILDNGIETIEIKIEEYDKKYKPVCEVEKPSNTAKCRYIEYPLCIVQEWYEDEIENNN